MEADEEISGKKGHEWKEKGDAAIAEHRAEKSAMAPMGVKFHGCGTMRNTAARMIITAARMARSAKT